MSEIKVGSIVELLSGSPPMTVASVGATTGTLRVTWYEKPRLRSGNVGLAEVRLVPAGESYE